MAYRAADVSRQASYDWQTRAATGPTQAQLAEVVLVDEMRVIADDFDETYGEPPMTVELFNRGYHVNPKRVARLMRAHGIVVFTSKRRYGPRFPQRIIHQHLT